ncbi:UNVERIFIED_CONTAM: hypothetical protein GTU68_064424 [Idotea baltica]|nr:hypothetical protein [Idotea baltica]
MTDSKVNLPKKYKFNEVEENLVKQWEDQDTYKWNPEIDRDNTFSIDTPPPTVSGSLHVGHVFSYTQTDIIARFQRMNGKNIFYPMGWDDNGLPTERRVQNFYNIKCDPSVEKNFIEACEILTIEDEKAFEKMWRRLGLSVDWSQTYSTINSHCREVSQRSFLDLVKKDKVYNLEAPTMWDVDFKSAIAQAEIEDRERPGAYHDIRFQVEGGDEFIISTTRPELLPACIAVVAHPDDERFKDLFGKFAITPLFHAKVPILPAEHADPEKGTGILMICTFGDSNDVEWWKQSDLALKQIINRQGQIKKITYGEDGFTSEKVELAKSNFDQLAGLYLNQENSSVDGKNKALVKDPEVISHPVKFFEKGDRPLEFITTRQWFIKTLEYKDKLIEQGNKINWHPEYMKTRYDNWVLGLNQDWCISRQRFFGVPFPVWYPIDNEGEIDYQNPIFAEAESLPIDPAIETPKGFSEDQREKNGGFTADPDIMDTWATSSLTPQIASNWEQDSDKHKKVFPMDIRPQAHEIIRTWAFSTIVKAWMHEDTIPWKNIVISGWILDPDRKKMSKSKGNVVVPDEILEKYSSDAVRYWAARARLGVDTAYDESLFKIGGKLTTKLFNASKFVLMQIESADTDLNNINLDDITVELDCALISNMKTVIEESTKAFDNFEFANALGIIEDSFWNFCDNYLELVKSRSYTETNSPERRSAISALGWTLKTYLKLFAPFMPYITEEIWAHSFKAESDSIHTAEWPSTSEIEKVVTPSYPLGYDLAVDLISKIRASKSSSQKSLKWEVEKLEITCKDNEEKAIQAILKDLINAGNIKDNGVLFDINDKSDNISVDVKLSDNWEPQKKQQ